MAWHLGLVNALAGCQSNALTAPYLLWDSRTWAGSGADLINLGTSGSVFNLKYVVYTSGLYHAYAFRKYKNWFASGDGTGGPYPSTWAHFGGRPCDSSWTVMYALPEYYDPVGTHHDYDIYTEMDAYVQNSIYSPTRPDNTSAAFSCGLYLKTVYHDDSDPTYRIGGFLETLFTGGFAGYSPGDNASPAIDWDNLDHKLVTIHYNEQCRTMDIWLNTTLLVHLQAPDTDDYVPIYSDPDHNTYYLRFPAGTQGGTETCTASDDGLNTPFEGLFLYFGEHRYTLAPPAVGDAWNCGVGTAAFRGKPSSADLAWWVNYFYP